MIVLLVCLALVVVGAYGMLRDARSTLIDAQIVQSNGPVDVHTARSTCPVRIPFPDTARNIQFASWSLWVGYADYVKFEAPLEDCIAAAETILRTSNAPAATRPAVPGEPGSLLHRLPEYNANTIALDDRPNGVKHDDLDAPWFDPATIRAGFHGGERDSGRPMVWIDAERGVFYYRVTD